MFSFVGVTSYLIFLLFVGLLTWIFYLLVVKHWNHFTERNVNFYRGIPLLGSHALAMLGRTSMPESVQNAYNKYPKNKVLGLYEVGGRPSYMIRGILSFFSSNRVTNSIVN